MSKAKVRTLTFTTIVIANLCLILTNRSWSDTMVTTLRTPNRAMMWVFAGTLISRVLVLTTPVLQELFRFSAISFPEFIICVSDGVMIVIWFEFYKVRNSRNST